jgi:hypothetical protein
VTAPPGEPSDGGSPAKAQPSGTWSACRRGRGQPTRSVSGSRRGWGRAEPGCASCSDHQGRSPLGGRRSAPHGADHAGTVPTVVGLGVPSVKRSPRSPTATGRSVRRRTYRSTGAQSPPPASAGQPAALGIPDCRLGRVCAGGVAPRLPLRCRSPAAIRAAGSRRRCPRMAGFADRGHGRVLRGRASGRSRRGAEWAELGTESMRAGAWVGPMRDRRSPSASGGTGRRGGVDPDHTPTWLPVGRRAWESVPSSGRLLASMTRRLACPPVSGAGTVVPPSRRAEGGGSVRPGMIGA